MSAGAGVSVGAGVSAGATVSVGSMSLSDITKDASAGFSVVESVVVSVVSAGATVSVG